MPLDFEKDETTGRILITDLPVTRMAETALDVRVGHTLVGRVEQLASGLIELFLHKALKDSGRPFRLDEVFNENGEIVSIELNWM
jgi:hypothetical protein